MTPPSVVLGKAVYPLASALATAVAGAGAWVIAQAGALADWPELLGGGVVLAAGILSLRMVLRSARHERESAATIETALKAELERARGRAEELEAELGGERQRAARLLLAFDRERNLRIALEGAGLTDRRASPDNDPLDLIKLTDLTDLTPELEAEANSNGDENAGGP